MTQTQFPKVAIYNDKSSGETDAAVEKIVAALQTQVQRDFEPHWHTRASVSFVPSTGKPPGSAWVIAVLDNSDQAGALGYHDLTPAGLPLGKVFAGTDRQYGETLSVTLSHELLEMLGDPWINLSAQGPDGKFYAWENCDAVEADHLGYQVDGILVSDFVTPAWWGNGAGPLDFMGRLSKPLELAPGGYIGVFDPASGQGWSQVTAQHARRPLPGVEALAHPRVGSRRERRFRRARGGVWVHSTFETSD